ncbi:MAG: hypothetical protein LBC77_03265 [Spirochaetaceae bacterium]|nr:hypothetical protein [Spirochaetaceae bacterium]
MQNKKLWGMAGVIVLSLVMSGALFAQDEDEGWLEIGENKLKFSGSVKTGLRVDNNSKKGNFNDVTSGTFDENADGDASYTSDIYLYSADIDDGTHLRAELGAEFKAEIWGFKLNVRRNWNGPYDGFDVSNAYGYVKLFDGLLTPYAGKIDDNIWGTGALGDTGTDKNYDAITGFRIAVQPIEALNIGLGVNMANDEKTPYEDEDWKKLGDAYTFQQFWGNLNLGAAYTSDLVKASLAARLHPQYKYVYSTPTPYKYTSVNRGVDLLAGLKITPSEQLLIVVDGELTHLGLDDDDVKAAAEITNPDLGFGLGTQEVYVKGQYAVSEAITAGLRVHFKNFNQPKQNVAPDKVELDADESFQILDARLYGSYAINEVITAGLEAEFDFYLPSKNESDSDAQKKFPDADKTDKSVFRGFYVKPNVKFAIGKNFSVVIFDKITINNAAGWKNMGDDKYGRPNNNSYYVNDKNELQGWIFNTVQIDFVYSF